MDRYWETFNEIDGDFEDVAIRTFKVGLPIEHDLRKSLTMKPASNMRQLIDCIDKHKQVKEDQTQGKGKTKVFPEKRDPQVGGYNHNRHGRDFSNQSPRISAQIVNSMFKEPVYQILKKIKKKISHTSNGPIRWGETCPSKSKVFTITTIRKRDIKLRIAGLYVITGVNW